MTDAGRFVELQGTAEGPAFERSMMDRMIDLGAAGIRQLNDLQRDALAGPGWRCTATRTRPGTCRR